MNGILRPNRLTKLCVAARRCIGVKLEEKENVDHCEVSSEKDMPPSDINSEISDKESTFHGQSNFDIDTKWRKWWEGSFGSHPGRHRLPPVKLPENFITSSSVYLKEFYNYHPQTKVLAVCEKLCNVLYYRPVPNHHPSSDSSREEKWFMKQYMKELAGNELYESNQDGRKKKVKPLWKQIVYDRLTSAAYLVARSPAIYATTLRVMQEIHKRDPDFRPQNMLNYGSGTGTAVWAANTTWGKSVEDFFCVDWSNVMNEMAQFLFTGGQENAELAGIYLRLMMPISFKHEYDVVVAAYTLSELPSEKERLTTIKLLWERTKKYLIIIERGKYDGYHVIMEARNLIAKGIEGSDATKEKRKNNLMQLGHIFAPCPHDKPCPKWKSSPCSFKQSYIPPVFAKKFLGSETRNESFSYIVLSKEEVVDDKDWPRVIAEPHTSKGQVVCHLCAADGNLHHIQMTRGSQKSDMRQAAKKSRSGDRLPYTCSGQMLRPDSVKAEDDCHASCDRT